VSVSGSGHFNLRRGALGTHCIGPRTCVDTVTKRKTPTAGGYRTVVIQSVKISLCLTKHHAM
jgi:hypothetical protein